MLEVNNVSYAYTGKYQRNEVLCDISCVFESNMFYSIMGPSGSGKTTLLSLMAGLDLPEKGEILYGGRSLAMLNRDRYRRDVVSVIYQSFNLFPLLTALENVMFPMLIQGKGRKEAEASAREYIAGVNLNDGILHKRPPMMSGGEQQRIAIARALAVGGRILLADEPTGNLDVKNGVAVVQLLKAFAHERNYIVVVITHSEAVAEQTDVVYTITDGRMIG